MADPRNELAVSHAVFDHEHGVAPAEPRFPEPYLSQYRALVAQMKEEARVLPGMHTAVGMLIEKAARDHIANLMVDRGDAFGTTIRCGTCHSTLWQPFWPEKDARSMAALQQLLTQAARADLESALRQEFVLGLVSELMRVLDGSVDEPEQRLALKERLRESFTNYLARVETTAAKKGGRTR